MKRLLLCFGWLAGTLAVFGCAAPQVEPVFVEPEPILVEEAGVDPKHLECPGDHDDGIGGTGCAPADANVARSITLPSELLAR